MNTKSDLELLVIALKRIKEECEKHSSDGCFACPMYCEDDEDGCLVKCEPSEWKINKNVTKVLLYEDNVTKSEVAGNE